MAKAATGRHDFSMSVLRSIAEQVGYLCSNPGCGAPTRGPSKAKGASNVGVGAHITAAAAGGPRYDGSLTKAERTSADNAIWLCARCGRLVDNDTATYTKDGLLDWKTQAIRRAHRALETGKTPRPGPSKRARAHDEARFRESESLMSEQQLMRFVKDLDDDSFHMDVDDPLEDWVDYFALESHQFLIPSLRQSCLSCAAAMVELERYIARSFFIFPERAGSRTLALYPHLNVDRAGTGMPDDVEKYIEESDKLHGFVREMVDAYRVYRRAVKEQLAI
jgi:hypothetical protein